MAQKSKQELELEQLITSKRNSVIDAELNARYWKAQYEIKYYTILEAGTREEYAKVLEEKQKALDAIDSAVKESIDILNTAEKPEAPSDGQPEQQTEKPVEYASA